jgi:hypothetical protein
MEADVCRCTDRSAGRLPSCCALEARRDADRWTVEVLLSSPTCCDVLTRRARSRASCVAAVAHSGDRSGRRISASFSMLFNAAVVQVRSVQGSVVGCARMDGSEHEVGWESWR